MSESLLLFETTIQDSKQRTFCLSMEIDQVGILVMKLEDIEQVQKTLLCAKDLKAFLENQSELVFEEIAIALSEDSYSLDQIEENKFLLSVTTKGIGKKIDLKLITEEELDVVEDSFDADIPEDLDNSPLDLKELYYKSSPSLISPANVRSLYNISFSKVPCTSWSANNLSLSSFVHNNNSYLLYPSEKGSIVIYDVNKELVKTSFYLSPKEIPVNILKIAFVPWTRKFLLLLHFAYETFVNLYGYGYKNVWELGEAVTMDDPRVGWVRGEPQMISLSN